MTTPRMLAGAFIAIIVIAVGYRLAMPRGRGDSVQSSVVQIPRDPTAKNPAAPSRGSASAQSGAPQDAATLAATAPNAPAQILARITALKIAANQPKNVRELIFELEQLKRMGAAALPALREFLASGQDADYDAVLGKMGGLKDGKVPADFTVPPSLRLALLEVAKNIGGPDAEAMLARELKTTGRGVEAAYVAAALDQLSPGKYRDQIAAAARDLLAMPLTTATKNLLDRSDREYLYHMLSMAGDSSQVAQAQTQLLLPNGQLDRGALHYLQEALGPGAIEVAARAWNDPRLTPKEREPLARVALTWVGTDDRAEQFYQAAINDPNLPANARKNLVEDLNQDGFKNPKQLGATDLPLIERRLAFIEKTAPAAKDPVLVAAFAEAKKDLLGMRDKAKQPPKR